MVDGFEMGKAHRFVFHFRISPKISTPNNCPSSFWDTWRPGRVFGQLKLTNLQVDNLPTWLKCTVPYVEKNRDLVNFGWECSPNISGT